MTMATSVTTAVFHVGLNVTDLDRAVRFYEILFGKPPAKKYHDYAKFEIDEPPLALALHPSPQLPGGALNHVGLRLSSSEELVNVQRRLEEAGLATQRQDGVECCYARQTKFWVTDPDKVLWEIYTLHDDLDHSGFEDPPLSPDVAAAEAVWEHRLTEQPPLRIPHCNDSLDVVRLEGTFNASLDQPALHALLTEALRVLKPGGSIEVHGLVCDRPFPGKPNLPGLASLVRHVPTETEPLNALEQAGFTAMSLETLGAIHCFGVDGIQLREMRLRGKKPLPPGNAAMTTIIYRGPFEELVSDSGTVFRRGQPIQLSSDQVELIRRAGVGDQFVFIP